MPNCPKKYPDCPGGCPSCALEILPKSLIEEIIKVIKKTPKPPRKSGQAKNTTTKK